MSKSLFLLTALTGGAMALACRSGASDVALVIPAQDAAAPLVLAQDEADIPCAPRHVLQTICQRCHTKPQQNGAPFPLINRSDIVVNTYGDVVVRELMIEEVTSGRMPLTPVTIGEEDKSTLLDWLNAGAPADPNVSCEDAGTDAGDAGTEDANDAQ